MTYQGHAGVGRPVPSPQQRPGPGHPPQPHRKTPQNVDTSHTRPESEDQRDGSNLIAPKKVRGTPTMYADLQFPKSSNSGDMKRGGRNMRARIESERDRFLPRHKTEYGRIVFNPAFAERANV